MNEINSELNILKDIAIDISNQGGIAFFVGGYVRDKILGKVSKDIDIEVFNITAKNLENILSQYGKVSSFGNKFGVFKIHGINIDFSLPRKEKNIGLKHQDFEIEIDSCLDLKSASIRRDFTINSIMQNVLTEEIIDNWNGIDDINNKCIRHIDSNTFVQDELRVLRACQFAARFNFEISEETINLCKRIDCSHLPKERIFSEIEKTLLQSNKPSIFFEYCRKIGLLSNLFSPIDKLINLKQNPIYHPEGDVWTHTMMVLDEGAKIRERSNYEIAFMLACICHDLGKITTTRTKNGRIISYNHENQLHLTEKFLNNITDNKDLIKSVKILVRNHMRPNILIKQNSSNKAIRKLIVDTSGKLVNIKDCILLSKADRMGRSYDEVSNNDIEKWWEDRLLEVNNRELTIIPLVNGKDLLEMGFTQGIMIGNALKYAFKLQIEGLEREDILKLVKDKYRY